MLPLMSMEDAFVLSHTSEPVNVPDQEEVDEFLPPLNLKFRIDTNNPMGYGSYSTPDGPFMEIKKDMIESMKNSKSTIREVTRSFAEAFGRDYSGLIEEYAMEDADYALIASGTLASTGKYVVGKMREMGKKVGIIRLRFFRPFPEEEIVEATKDLKGVGVLDRSVSYGSSGSIANEVKSSLYENSSIPVTGFVAGLGGRDVRIEDFEKMFDYVKKGKTGNYFIGDKEGM